ncbi:MAG: T9SS C-terminal target domain-containing protein [Bacteroidetes bacterium]|nr:MAG: T9SS C-terminal target domain-containing protein [Bacteroidota bacterium]
MLIILGIQHLFADRQAAKSPLFHSLPGSMPASWPYQPPASRFNAGAKEQEKLEGYYLDGDAFINWWVSPDSRHRQFLIERSFDGQTFELLAQVNMSRAQPSRGEYIDRQVSRWKVPQLYYRISCVSPLCAHTYSKTVEVVVNEVDELALYAFANPANNCLNLQYFSLRQEPLILEVHDQDGKLYHRQNLPGGQGERQLSFPLNLWKPGQYYFRLSCSQQSVIEKVVLK